MRGLSISIGLLILCIQGCASVSKESYQKSGAHEIQQYKPEVQEKQVQKRIVQTLDTTKTPKEIVQELGKPTFQKSEGNTQQWRYETEQCTLTIYWVKESMSGNMAKNIKGEPIAISICLPSVKAREKNA